MLTFLQYERGISACGFQGFTKKRLKNFLASGTSTSDADLKEQANVDYITKE